MSSPTLRSVLVLVLVVGFGSSAWARQKETDTLFYRLGGEQVVRNLVDDLYARLAVDPRTKERFEDVDLQKLKNNVFFVVAQATGGPFAYGGKDLKSVHRKLKITEQEWSALLDALNAALDKNHIEPREHQEVVKLIGTLKSDIVHQDTTSQR